MKKRKSPVLIVILLILIVAILGVGTYYIKRYMPTKEQMDLEQYYGTLNENEAALIIGDTILDERALLADDMVYISISVVNQYLNQKYYWDSSLSKVLYATPSEITEEEAVSESGQNVWLYNDTVYLSTDYIRQYTDIDLTVETEPSRVAIQNEFTDAVVAEVNKNNYVRYQGGIKSPVLTKVSAGDSLYIIEEMDTWYRVLTKDGFIGYIQKKVMGMPQEYSEEREFSKEEYTYLTMENTLNLVWHLVTNTDANAGITEAAANMSGVNVISPTWYSVTDNNGNFSNIASADYVNTAHEMGLQVWGLVDNFNTEISTYTLLSNRAARNTLITGLIESAVSTGQDGINVDFESLTEDTIPHFLEFLRELSIECHKNNLILSVDDPVPENYTTYYDRSEQGEAVDYLIIMGYDEHYAASEKAGSVASLPWVEQGIIDTIAEVPAERVINAVPFYTRLWKTEAGTLSSEVLGMDGASEIITEYNVETYWDTTASQNVGKFETEEASYQIWLEDNESIAAKIQLVSKYSLAGTAAWRLGFESDSIWTTIAENL